MALYVDCAFLDDIINIASIVPLAGVTTNPSIMLAAHEKGQRITPSALLEELLSKVSGTIFIQPGTTGEQDMYAEASRYIQAMPDRVIPKLPMTRDGMRVAQRLKSANRRIAFTAVTTVSQAYCAAMTGADFIIPYYNRLTRTGVDAGERIAQIAEILHNQRLDSRILAASIKSTAEAAEALLAGAHDLTIVPQVLQDMVVDPASEEAVVKFAHDWQKMNNL
jgi:TalC/MipB family fructose-6-phosphate aldolase